MITLTVNSIHTVIYISCINKAALFYISNILCYNTYDIRIKMDLQV